MDAREVTRAKHAAELEAKKRKLEEIRRRKANVKEAGVDAATISATSVAAAPFQDFLQTILDEQKQKDLDVTMTNESSATTVIPGLSFAEKMAKLSTVVQVGPLDILPIQVETYDKATSMDPDDFPPLSPRHLSVQDDSISHEPEPANSPVQATSAGTSPRKFTSDLSAPPPVRLTKEEREQLLLSADLDAFLGKSGRVMERALIQASSFDVMKDYSVDGADADDDGGAAASSQALKLAHVYRDAKWTKGRAVTDIDVSPFYHELSLVAYNARGYLEDDDDQASWDVMHEDGGDAEGVVLLWSSNLPSHPEYKFTCHSQVMSACFSPFDRNLLVGGTYSGQVVLWDTRAKHTPVQKTTLSATGGHTHPIYSMSVVGTKSSSSLVSASTDGRMCVWNMNQLHTPMDVLDLRVAGPSSNGIAATSAATSAAGRRMAVPVTAMAFQRPSQNPTNAFAIGTESGDLWGAQLDELHPSSESKAREVLVSALPGLSSSHFGPVTSMQYHPLVPHHQDVLLLTSSVDWSCRLWSQKGGDKPIMSFEPANDYVYDIRWSPVHPGLFCTADGSGKASVWNISNDSEVPVAEVQVSTERALNKVRWTADGKRLLVGDSAGDTHVYDVPSEISQPRPDEMARLESKLSQAIARTTDVYMG
ncbi:hypothetical protein, variant 1 [Aphanomyces astaci]|uniref:Dynein intermediate chain, cytosolic n=2 Tax=Aphanomyces astaci TaxID=112090 RepID=W4FXJ5_APHAT|nr:hypothetical protein, variant 1 [Aphanomyces astaci]ETV72212.1 hypothetical protein, variant 1 [Aphanomyces astaci]|eukprot:XP_009838281.1 hypothetical protein, variant 1 [Aphanomyces astaci]